MSNGSEETKYPREWAEDLWDYTMIPRFWRGMVKMPQECLDVLHGVGPFPRVTRIGYRNDVGWFVVAHPHGRKCLLWVERDDYKPGEKGTLEDFVFPVDLWGAMYRNMPASCQRVVDVYKTTNGNSPERLGYSAEKGWFVLDSDGECIWDETNERVERGEYQHADGDIVARVGCRKDYELLILIDMKNI